MSIVDGRVKSRVPAFDRLYGISELKNTSDRLSGGKTRVLMALGGYSEESPQFSRLGRDSVAMDTLVADIVTMMVDLRLDGLAIHWVLPAGACQPSDVNNTLSVLFANVKKLLVLNNLPALMTLILPYGDTATVGSMSPDLVDFFFFVTHQFRPNTRRHDLCQLYREHRDAFELPEEIFRKQYRLPKIVVRWLCDELREEPEVRRVRTSWTVMTVELQVLCALRFYGTGSFQGMVASDEHVARDQKTVSVAVRAVSVAIVRRLGVQRGWIHFPETPSERFDAEKGFRLLGRIPGVIGCVDGTMVSIVGPSKNDPTVTKAAYWCRKYFYALNVMVVCDADCRIMCIDPRYPGSVHDSFVWQFSWLRNQLEQGQVPRDGRFLLGDSGYPLEPWLITPVPGNHATSTACGRFNKAHSSISAPQHLPCIERARTGVRLRP
ncbi:putative nuclease HARBI1 isoform X1 [Ixodes scapularis]